MYEKYLVAQYDAGTSRQIIGGFRRQKLASLCGFPRASRGKENLKAAARRRSISLLSISHTRYFIRTRSGREKGRALCPRVSLDADHRAGKTYEKRRGLRWAFTRGNKRWLKPSPPFSFPGYAFSYIGIHRAFAAGAIYEYHYRIYFMVLQADAVTDRSAARSERHARFIKFRRRNGGEIGNRISSLSWLVPRIYRARHAMRSPCANVSGRPYSLRRVKLDCVLSA